MTDKHPSAPAPAKTRHSHSGVIHENEPHTENFTVVGNHLLQHPDLSLTAIGLAVHIQSLPAGASIGIKTLAGKFPEGEIRIAAALRELEEHGYLTRARERLQSGQVTTRTTSYNRPRTATAPAAEPTVPVPAPPKASAPGRTPAVGLLTRLRTYDSRLLLSERDVQRLVPDVSAWFERGVGPTAVERALTSGLPQDPIRHPAAFLACRLRELLPPSLPVPTPHPASPPPSASVRPDRFQDCDGCDRPFRSPEPGQCRDCRLAGAA
ncbi:DNA-binding protein [Streptomyces sp. WM6386]|uniref:DNA-binding protein n=1 Tax=Streptomyces sp. WM6386 TaxID=1415558 RepID=UPI000619FA43|nr:DNA-binding protein [Streptomyces sp. WM6386]KKD04094.1 DNA-binding protein [Streptomyces sp. WM6386]